MTDELVALREASFVAEADLVPAGKGRDEYVMTIMSKQVIIFTCFTSTCFTSTKVQVLVMTSMSTQALSKSTNTDALLA